MPKKIIEVKEGQLDTKNIAANIRYEMALKGWSMGRLQLNLWRKQIYMYPTTIRRILAGNYPMTGDLVKKMAKALAMKRKDLTNTIVVNAPRSIDELLMLSDNSMRTFFGGCDEIGLKWIRDSLFAIRNKNAQRKIAYMKRAGPDAVEVKRWLLTGQISEEAFVRIYLDKNIVKPKRLTKREKKEFQVLRQRRKALYDQGGKIPLRRRGQPSSPIQVLRTGPPEYWPS